MIKKIFICLCLFLSSLTFIQADEILSANNYYYKINENGNVTITRYAGGDANVQIPSSLNGTTVEVIGEGAFADKAIRNLTIPDTVKKIEKNAFFECDKLQTVEMGNGVEVIEEQAFSWCFELYRIDFSNNLKEVEERAFQGCKLIENIELPDSLTYIAPYMFYQCEMLKTINIDSHIKRIHEGAFMGCNSLTAITIPKETTLDPGALSSCILLEAINIEVGHPDLVSIDGIVYTKDLTTIYQVPAGLSKITIDDNITTIESYAFYSCDKVTKIDIPGTVKEIKDYAFSKCSYLMNLTLNEGIEKIGKEAFSNCCYSLGYVTIPASVKEIGIGAFSGCNVLKQIKVDVDNANFIDIDGVLYTKDGKQLLQAYGSITSIFVMDSVEEIAPLAFKNCYELRKVILPDTITKIGEQAFYYCARMESFSFPRSVDTIERQAFYCCNNIETFYLPASVKTIEERAFQNCFGLKKLVMNDSVETIGEYAFSGCTGVRNIYISKNVNSLGDNLFNYCKVLNVISEEGSLAQSYVENTTFTFEANTMPLCVDELQGLIDLANSLNKDSYTDDSVAVFTTALTNANDTVTNAKTQQELDEASVALKGSILGLESKESELIDRSELEKAIKEAQAIDLSTKTTISANTLKNTLTSAIAIYNNSNVSQSVVDNTTNALRSAINNLQDKDPNAIDTSLLEKVIKEVQAMDTTNKTDDSVKALNEAIKQAQAIIDKADVTQAEINEAKANLEAAVAELKDKPSNPTPDPKPAMNFVDVTEKDWFYGSVESAYQKGLMSNTGKGKEYFEPNAPITRGMVATVLYRMAGLPKVEFKATFSDVTNAKLWYATAITWASQSGVVSGYKDGSFGPDDNITRQDLAIMLRNFAKANGLDTNAKVDFSAFKDGNKVVSYAQSAIAFCTNAKLMSGAKKNDGVYLNPSANATRGECAKMFSLLDDAIKAK